MPTRLTNATHLTYCLNVHPGESWAENLAAIREKAMAVRDAVSPARPFGLGLRLSRVAADQLAAGRGLAEFRSFLDDNGLYAFTINGFPYGPFHGQPVKASVYEPDWRRPERLAYTNRLADILAALLPEGVAGSISTVPGAYKAWIQSDGDRVEMVRHLAACARHLDEILKSTGRRIVLGLEPEPDCFLETTEETVGFLEDHLYPAEPAARRHVGVCFDTCHMALQFEDAAAGLKTFRNRGIPIAKIQISAAIRAPLSGHSVGELRAFIDPVYFHQTRIRASGGGIRRFPDLTEEVVSLTAGVAAGELRSHFHVPLYFEGGGALFSTAAELSPGFFRALVEGGGHVEIETYTFGVLPEGLRAMGVIASVIREFAWVQDRLTKGG